MSDLSPVSPLISKSSKAKEGSIEGVGDLAEEELDPKSVAVEDLIVGEDVVTLGEDIPGAIGPKQGPAPKEMSAAEREKHFAAGHLPYGPRCEICVQCKRPNLPHPKSNESKRTIPLLVGDYGFTKDGSDDENATILVLKLHPFKLTVARLVSEKGSDPLVATRLRRFVMECGLVHFAYRSDREPAIASLIQDACAMAGRNGVNVRTSRMNLLKLRLRERKWLFPNIATLASPNRMGWPRVRRRNLSMRFAL